MRPWQESKLTPACSPDWQQAHNTRGGGGGARAAPVCERRPMEVSGPGPLPLVAAQIRTEPRPAGRLRSRAGVFVRMSE